WWSYMELGWGGYWAWDPVENASLIPWFCSTAFLHTSVIESKRGALQRSNVFLMAMTFLLCIFATYLVRSGVDVQSLHTFGEGGEALPLTLFMLVGLGLAILVTQLSDRPEYRALSGFASRQGLLVIVCWLMVALGLVVGMGTMWPVISKLWASVPVGLDPTFYNRVCLPLLTLTMLLFCICPWMDWKEGVRNLVGLSATGGVFLGAAAVFYFQGVTDPLPLIAASAAVAGLVSLVLLFVLVPTLRRSRHSWGSYAIHLGLTLMVLAVAFSGPYKTEMEARLDKGGTMQIGDYTLFNRGVSETSDGAVKVFVADLAVMVEGEPVGVMNPERRWYPNSKNSFAEVSVIPSLGDEIYSTLLGYDLNDGSVTVKISVNPLINWLWIGGTLMSLAPLLLLRRRNRV
ncbi:MAG: cytochrome c biogenesis protein CcsA, partial [Proteobacteria bacterium]|nr:cytochrome c biogenesis protein CcsA [Pseudomonadota bacterium]